MRETPESSTAAAATTTTTTTKATVQRRATATLRLREAACGDPSLSPETAPWALSKCSLVARPSRCLASGWHAVGAQQMTVAGCHLSALHPSPAPVQPGVQHETGAETSVPLWRLVPLGAVDPCSQQAGSGAERVLAGWWGIGGALQPGQPARLPGTSTAPPAPLKAALGRRFHLDFVERARYTRTKPKCPRSLRLRQALPGAPPIEAAPVSSHHTPTGHKGP